MATKIAISDRTAAFILFDNGLDFEDVKEILDTVKQPTEGYYYSEDITEELKKYLED